MVRAIVGTFPSFRDAAVWMPISGLSPSIEIRLFKRAQILVSDLAGAFANTGELHLEGRDQLTAFADYKVPRVLRHLGILRYGDKLAAHIQEHQHLGNLGTPFPANDVDWLLWNPGQSLPPTGEPYHRIGHDLLLIWRQVRWLVTGVTSSVDSLLFN